MPEKTLHFQNPRLLSQLYCAHEDNLAKVERSLEVKLVTRDDWLQINGASDSIEKAEELFELLHQGRAQGMNLRDSDFESLLSAIARGNANEVKGVFEDPLVLDFRRRSVVPKTINQKRYLQQILQHDIVLGIGPAGTGKTYLAVAAALSALMHSEIKRVILTRPAVEAGEALGFLPGDLKEKIQPYLRPLYDAMYDLLGSEQSNKLLEREIVEIAPLAYMRGRTLSDAFIILDEAQNTTPEQMMMFLTRLGEGAKMVITGDVTQIDLPRKEHSGLKQARHILTRVNGICVFEFHSGDVVRHRLVQRIIDAYSRYHHEAEEFEDSTTTTSITEEATSRS